MPIITGLQIQIRFPKAVSSASADAAEGHCSFQEMTKTLRWELKRLPESGSISLRGQVTLGVSEAIPDGTPPVQVKFKTTGYTASGLKVNRLDIYREVSLLILKSQPRSMRTSTGHAGRGVVAHFVVL